MGPGVGIPEIRTFRPASRPMASPNAPRATVGLKNLPPTRLMATSSCLQSLPRNHPRNSVLVATTWHWDIAPLSLSNQVEREALPEQSMSGSRGYQFSPDCVALTRFAPTFVA